MRVADLNPVVKFATELIDSLIRLRPLISKSALCLYGANVGIYDHVFLVPHCPTLSVCVRGGSPRITFTNFFFAVKSLSWSSLRESGRLVDIWN